MLFKELYSRTCFRKVLLLSDDTDTLLIGIISINFNFYEKISNETQPKLPSTRAERKKLIMDRFELIRKEY